MWKVYYKGKTDKYYILVLKLFYERGDIRHYKCPAPQCHQQNF